MDEFPRVGFQETPPKVFIDKTLFGGDIDVNIGVDSSTHNYGVHVDIVLEVVANQPKEVYWMKVFRYREDGTKGVFITAYSSDDKQTMSVYLYRKRAWCRIGVFKQSSRCGWTLSSAPEKASLYIHPDYFY